MGRQLARRTCIDPLSCLFTHHRDKFEQLDNILNTYTNIIIIVYTCIIVPRIIMQCVVCIYTKCCYSVASALSLSLKQIVISRLDLHTADLQHSLCLSQTRWLLLTVCCHGCAQNKKIKTTIIYRRQIKSANGAVSLQLENRRALWGLYV